jgi:glycosyltransferase involved in cell wall biosynthesis
LVNPDVSVVIPAMGRWDLLRMTLATVLDQRGADLEVIIVDASPTAEIANNAIALGDERVRPVHLPKSGIAAARNRGVAEARGEWVAFLDSDNLWAPWKLVSQLRLAGDAAFTFSACVVIDAEYRVTTLLAPPDDDGDLYRKVLRGADAVPSGASNVIARTAVIREMGGFDEGFSILDDWDLLIRLARDYPSRHSPEVVVAHREHDASDGTSRAEVALAETQRLMDKHRSHDLLDRERLLRWVISGYRRSGRRAAASRGYLRLLGVAHQPRDLARAGGVLLGERAMRLGQRPHEPLEVPWLDELRQSFSSEPR